MNSDLFNIYLKEYLVPELKPGQIVIMDNARTINHLKQRKLLKVWDVNYGFYHHTHQS
jgi:transposase